VPDGSGDLPAMRSLPLKMKAAFQALPLVEPIA
jgi:hypothetical protein